MMSIFNISNLKKEVKNMAKNKNKKFKFNNRANQRLLKQINRDSDKYINEALKAYKSSLDYHVFLNKFNQLLIPDELRDKILKFVAGHIVTFDDKVQQFMMKEAIDKTVGTLITNVNEDAQSRVREIIKSSFETRTPVREVEKQIMDGLKIYKSRAYMINRTESMRAHNVSDYLVNKERGAMSWSAMGFDDDKTCEDCLEIYGTTDDPIYYSIDDIENLPPSPP